MFVPAKRPPSQTHHISTAALHQLNLSPIAPGPPLLPATLVRRRRCMRRTPQNYIACSSNCRHRHDCRRINICSCPTRLSSHPARSPPRPPARGQGHILVVILLFFHDILRLLSSPCAAPPCALESLKYLDMRLFAHKLQTRSGRLGRTYVVDARFYLHTEVSCAQAGQEGISLLPLQGARSMMVHIPCQTPLCEYMQEQMCVWVMPNALSPRSLC